MATMDQYLNMRLLETVRVLDVEGLRRVINQHRANPTFPLDVDVALCLAAKTGHAETVRQLLQAKASPSYTDKEGNRAIHYAARSGSWKVVKLILNAGSPMNVPDRNGASVLHLATEGGYEDLVKMLLQEGANTNRARLLKTGETPLHLACKSGHFDIPQLLISRGADVNVVTRDEQWTPLHCAVKAKHFHTVRVLCEKRADVNMRDRKGRTPLCLAVELGSHENTDCLLKCGADPTISDRNGRSPLHSLAIASTASSNQLGGSCENTDWLLKCGADPTILDRIGRSPLHLLAIAATAGGNQLGIAQQLLELGAVVNQRDTEGCTPLHYAAMSGNTDIGVLLISAGAELDLKDSIKGETPLNTAIAHDRAQLAQLLIHSGADVTIMDQRHLTPLHNAQGCKSAAKVELTRLLIEKGARLNPVTLRGDTPLDRCVFHFVLGNYNREVLVALVVAGALLRPIHMPGRPQHQSPLCWLTWHSQFSSARFLVMVGWSLHNEAWLNLPGKTVEVESFMDWLRQMSHRPQQLTLLCRKVIRERLVICSDDCEISPAIRCLPLPTFVMRQLALEEEVRMLHSGEL